MHISVIHSIIAEGLKAIWIRRRTSQVTAVDRTLPAGRVKQAQD